MFLYHKINGERLYLVKFQRKTLRIDHTMNNQGRRLKE